MSWVACWYAALKVLEECGAIAVLIPFLACEGRQVLAPDVVLALYGPSNDRMKTARPYIQSSPAMSALSRPRELVALGCVCASVRWWCRLVNPTVARYSSAQLAEKAQMTKEVQNAAMYTLFYLCRVNHPRQIIAVEHEIIPVLIKVGCLRHVEAGSCSFFPFDCCTVMNSMFVWLGFAVVRRRRVEATCFANSVRACLRVAPHSRTVVACRRSVSLRGFVEGSVLAGARALCSALLVRHQVAVLRSLEPSLVPARCSAGYNKN
jgi:hypothetical protein